MIEVLQIVTFEPFFPETSPRLACKFAHHCHSKRAKTLAELSVKCEEEKKEFEEEEDVNDVEGAFFLTNKYRVRH